MHFEYAVDPRAIVSSWEKCLYLSEKFGFDKGRVLALYPKRWLVLALDEVDAGIPPMQKKKIHAKLRALKRDCSIASGRNYDPMRNWVKNAMEQQNIKPFHAIITTENPNNLDQVLLIDEIEETHPLMAATSNRAISRDINSLSDAFSVLLRTSSQIAFVDPYFSLYDNEYTRILSHCLRFVQQLNPNKNCEIGVHYKYGDGMPGIAELERDANQFARIIPTGASIDVYCWRPQEGGEDFHDRFLLTNKGGISIGRGFKPAGSHMTTDMNLMDMKNAQFKLESFSSNSSFHELVERPLRIFAGGRTKRI